MTTEQNTPIQTNEDLRALLLAHGAAVLLIGLIAGLILIFSMLDGFMLWPLLEIPYDIPGSVQGWKAAHVGGIMNGLMVMGIGLILAILPMSRRAASFVFWSFLLTGWGNTVFYWAGLLAANRGLSLNTNQYGESSVAGVISFFGGASVMFLTIIGSYLIMTAAFRQARTRP